MIGTIVRYTWKQLFRDRAALVLSFLVPVGFFAIFAAVFVPDRRGMNPLRVAWVDLDGGDAAAALRNALAADPAIELLERSGRVEQPYSLARAEEDVRKSRIAAAVVVTSGFGGKRFVFGPNDDPPAVELLVDRTNPVAANLLAGLVQKAVFQALPGRLLEGGLSAFEAFVGFEPAQRMKIQELRERAERGATAPTEARANGGAWFQSPVAIRLRDLEGESRRKPMIAFYAASLGVMFLLFSAAGAGGVLLEERESGTLDRLLSTRLTLPQLLLGKLVYLASLGVAQLAVMFLFGAAFYGLELGGATTPMLLLIGLPTAAVSAAFGLLLASICRTRKQLVALSNLLILTISALGGSMFPRFLMPESIQKASLVFFNSWALEGFLDVLWRGESWVGLLPEVAVLLVWTAGLFLLSWRIARRFESV